MESTPVDASIVIVAWRLVDELQECLDAIAASADAPSHEVIVILNGASPETERVARAHPAVTRIISRYANVGFGAACNLAAAAAVGANLIFLNDDTRVDRRWLRELVDEAASHNGRCAVASLLLNFDGTVQEAGSRVLSHGGTLQWGAGLTLAEADQEGLLSRRMVDYGSAAALLVSRADFQAIGGFDPLFAPAYFEDVDFQLRLRETGVNIWFQPDAKVLHHSGRSTREDHWFRQFAANRSGYRFIERWADVLAGAALTDDPTSELCAIPQDVRLDIEPEVIDVDVDSSVYQALEMSRQYEAWLSAELDRLSDTHAERLQDPDAPSRAQLVERLHEQDRRVHELTKRVKDVEARGPVGLAKMRLGLLINRLRR